MHCAGNSCVLLQTPAHVAEAHSTLCTTSNVLTVATAYTNTAAAAVPAATATVYVMCYVLCMYMYVGVNEARYRAW
jgi:hypothetical protein